MDSSLWSILPYISLTFGALFLSWNSAWAIKCVCDYHCPDNHNNYTCETEGKCFAQTELLESDELRTTYGCVQHEEDGGIWQCRAKKHKRPRVLLCCDEQDYCNSQLAPTLAPTLHPIINPKDVLNSNENDSKNPTTHGIALVASVTVCCTLLVVVVMYLYFRYRQTSFKRRYDAERQIIIREGTLPVGSIRELLDSTSTSGSGAGVPLLIQRTISRQITLQYCVGKGRFGEVWKGKWRGEEVAVKMFLAREEASWYREAEFFQTVLLRHDNVLGFIAADIRGTGSETQLLLITEYHRYGSLYDFLQNHTFDHRIMMRLAYTAMSGLAYLHREIYGMKGKPALAHRDVKSKNFLVKDNLTLAIGDLGLAIRLMPDTKELDLGQNSRLPTIRYMAPELLDGTCDVLHFDSYRVADMYSFGLVLWELSRRCETGGFAEEYQQPYSDFIQSSDPSIEEMRKVVVTERRRPQIPNRWVDDEHLRMMSKVMTECWNHSPAARLTALRVKKTLQKFSFEEGSESSYS